MTPNDDKRALLVIDMQMDFLSDNGSLKVDGALDLIPQINNLAEIYRDYNLPVIFTQDWHSINNSHFQWRGGMWPVHCVRNTPGADIHPSLVRKDDDINVYKGFTSDGYSAFEDDYITTSLPNARYFYVVGVATDHCVKHTVLDALARKMQVSVLLDCIQGVDSVASHAALAEMQYRGAKLSTFLSEFK